MKLLIGISQGRFKHTDEMSAHACLKLGPHSENLRVAIVAPNKTHLWPHFSKLLRNLKYLNENKKLWWPVSLF